MEMRKKQDANASPPLRCERLRGVLETDENPLPEMAYVFNSIDFDVKLEHALERLRILGLARICGDLTTAFRSERPARQQLLCARNLADHLPAEGEFRSINNSKPNA